MKQQQQEQQSNILNNQKAYQCKCGKSYDRNSSLFNHIKNQHQNNKEYFLFTQSKVGRPQGLKDKTVRCPRGKAIEKRPIKEIQCKCGDILKGEGAFYNHVNGKHKGDSYYKQERKQQGRKKTSQQDVSVSDENNIKTEFQNNQTQQPSKQLNYTEISANQESESFSEERLDEENTVYSTQCGESESIGGYLNIFENNQISDTYHHFEKCYDYQLNDNFSQPLFSLYNQEDDFISQYFQ